MFASIEERRREFPNNILCPFRILDKFMPVVLKLLAHVQLRNVYLFTLPCTFKLH